jgi:hypothetical protein
MYCYRINSNAQEICNNGIDDDGDKTYRFAGSGLSMAILR